MFKNKKKGISLLEMLITISFIALIGTLVVVLLGNSIRNYMSNQETVRVQDKIAEAIRDFESVARGTTAVLVAENDQYIFYTYLAGDTHPAPSRIRYSYENGNLIKGRISPVGSGPTYEYPLDQEQTEVLCDYLTSDQLFSYYSDINYDYEEEDATLLSYPISTTAIRMVGIKISSDKNLNQPPAVISEETLVSLRNLKNNL